MYALYNSATNATISCKILVKIGPVVSVENSLTDGNSAATCLQFDDHRQFVMLALKTNLNIGILISVLLSVINSLLCVKFL